MRHLMMAMAGLLLLTAPAPASDTVVLPQGAALQAEIEKVDADLFETFFQRCDADHLAGMLMPDFEMYHDKDGEVARSAKAFLALYAGKCAERVGPDTWRSRRELVPGSMTLHPIAGVGVLEMGEHVFYERQGDGPEKRVGRARFTQFWRLEPGGWKLARVFSYDHEPLP